MSITNVSQCQVNDLSSEHGKIKIYWIEGQTTIINDHTTEVLLWCYVPATTMTPLGPYSLTPDSSGAFGPAPPFYVHDLCQPSGDPIPSKLLIEHTFHPDMGGTDQVVEEEHFFDVVCPPRGCDVLLVKKAK